MQRLRVAPARGNIDAVKTMVSRLWIIDRDVRFSAALFLKPFQVRSRFVLKEVEVTDEYDAVLLESEHVGPHSGEFSAAGSGAHSADTMTRPGISAN